MLGVAGCVGLVCRRGYWLRPGATQLYRDIVKAASKNEPSFIVDGNGYWYIIANPHGMTQQWIDRDFRKCSAPVQGMIVLLNSVHETKDGHPMGSKSGLPAGLVLVTGSPGGVDYEVLTDEYSIAEPIVVFNGDEVKIEGNATNGYVLSRGKVAPKQDP